MMAVSVAGGGIFEMLRSWIKKNYTKCFYFDCATMQLMDATSRNKYCNHDLFNQVMMAVSGPGGSILKMLRSRIKNECLPKVVFL